MRPVRDLSPSSCGSQSWSWKQFMFNEVTAHSLHTHHHHHLRLNCAPPAVVLISTLRLAEYFQRNCSNLQVMKPQESFNRNAHTPKPTLTCKLSNRPTKLLLSQFFAFSTCDSSFFIILPPSRWYFCFSTEEQNASWWICGALPVV